MYLFYRGESFNPNFYYFSGTDVDHSFLLVDSNKKTLLVPEMNYELAKKEFDGPVVVYSNWFNDLKNLIKNRKVSIDENSISINLYRKLKRITKLEEAGEYFLKIRAKKSKIEVAKIKKAVSLTKTLLNELDFSKLKTELEVKKYLLMRTLELDLEPAFRPIVSTNPNSRFPHYESKNVKLNDMVLVDYGLKYENYCADLTRCFFLKKGSKAEKNYRILKQIFYEIIDELPNFSTGRELAELQEKLFSKYKLPKPVHSLGHGVGLEVHEYPKLGAKSKDELNGAVLAIEPGAYFKDYGIRFEETIHFDGRKVSIL
ncbi:aminopeptidase P family protein [Candidatus Micrarchaeota archaeon]|nr:aminopeptidase P family protein [Candidatus Micrarchaeota archaeon]